MEDKVRKELGEILLEKGLITFEQLQEALEIQAKEKNYWEKYWLKRDM